MGVQKIESIITLILRKVTIQLILYAIHIRKNDNFNVEIAFLESLFI